MTKKGKIYTQQLRRVYLIVLLCTYSSNNKYIDSLSILSITSSVGNIGFFIGRMFSGHSDEFLKRRRENRQVNILVIMQSLFRQRPFTLICFFVLIEQ